MDEDLAAMTRKRLLAEVRRLHAGIRAHRDSTGHALCWHQPALCWHQPALWGLLPEQSDPLPTGPDMAGVSPGLSAVPPIVGCAAA